MSTVQSNLLKLAQRVDPTIKSSSVTAAGQKFQGVSDGTAITNVVTHGGLVQVVSANHGIKNNQYVTILGVTGTGGLAAAVNNTAGNPAWIATLIDANTIDLQGSTFAGAFTSGGTLVGGMVGSIGGRYTRQRLLDIYNEARRILFNALSESKSPAELGKIVYGTFTSASIAIATYSAPYRSIPKPSGFIKLVNMVDGATTPVRIDVLPTSLLEDVRTSITPTYTASATNLLAFEIGANWNLFGNFGTSPAAVDYYGIVDWTWITDVLPGTTVEVFRSDIEPMIIEIAEALANEQSNLDALALAKTLLNKRG